MFFFFSSRRRHTRCSRDWSSDVCSSDLDAHEVGVAEAADGVGAVGLAARPEVAPGEAAEDGRPPGVRRSEERRVGKECRSRWAAYHEKKKNTRTRVYLWSVIGLCDK